jgi:hypothetical protein
MADVPGGSSGILLRDYKGKEADKEVARIDPGVVSLVAELLRQIASRIATPFHFRGSKRTSTSVLTLTGWPPCTGG